MAKRVLFLDDVRNPGLDFIGAEMTIARTVEEALIAVGSKPTFDVWTLDHDLGLAPKEKGGLVLGVEERPAPSGFDFLKAVVRFHPEKWPSKVLVHSANPVGKENMLAYVAWYERMREEQ